jgi:hypothetical protein
LPTNSLSKSASTAEPWVSEAEMRVAVWPTKPDLISNQTLRLLCRQSRWPHLRIGGTYFFRISDVKKFLTDKEVTLAAAISVEEDCQRRIAQNKGPARGKVRV